jgi:hypothetical protein
MDYKVLHREKKLTYFNWRHYPEGRDGKIPAEPKGPYCHFCIGPEILKLNKTKEATAEIHYQDKDYEHTFYEKDGDS